ncbi:hypothetical protein CHS0354_031197 [Potamilus streckersoni]|uniref:Stabilizer of axonemal microtubules 2 n=1 Tax=Potamilus streckersoni TaxID=2493646 RepID=A0AAE0TLG4_9BIVA|nr:hypothetical protein CHS0354_031197 [Potamilus streckersoni]
MATLKEEDILAEKFPDDISISDLCDCGRHKRRKDQMPRCPRRVHSFPDTDYRSTYKEFKDTRPRSSKRPPPPIRDPNLPPMIFETSARTSYKAPEKVGRPPDFAPKDLYEPPTVPLEGETYYKAEFGPKKLELELMRRTAPLDSVRQSSAKFDGRTTYKDNHRQWVPQKMTQFGELPSFAGSILFPPSKEGIGQSITKQSFTGEFARRPDLIKMVDDHIGTEGEFDHLTTHNETYKQISGFHRPEKIVSESKQNPMRVKGKFQDETSFKSSFPAHLDFKRSQMVVPAPDTLDLKFDNKRSFETEQRKIYKGHDITKHPVAKSCKKDSETYQPPTVRFETETSQKRDYKPIDKIQALHSRATAVPPSAKLHTASDVKMEDQTSFQEFFKDWGVSQRVRHGDFHENRPYIPPQTKFNGESVTKSTFIPKKAEKVKDFKPEPKSFDREGNFDFNTVNNLTYQKPEIKPCRAAVYLLQKELKKRQAEQSSVPPPMSLEISAK